MIHAYDNRNEAIVDASNPILSRTYFNLVRLKSDETFTLSVRGIETCWVVLSGSCDIAVDGETFASVGQRKDIWSGQADSVYAPSGADVSVKALTDVEIAVAGSVCAETHKAYRVKPEDVRMVEVGSLDTHSRRRIFHILGSKDMGRTGNLLVSELYADPGCWSGYPPHKHDTDRPDGNGAYVETGFEEVYHYRFNPETGFGAQFNYYDDGNGGVYRTQHGDTYLVDRGYHPTVTSPGHAKYIFTILVGHTQHSLVQYFEEKHRWLTKVLPGTQAMVDLFTGKEK